jgi:DNA/RNA-binding domain of Phe-tRNA-synthetase-like protein
MNEIGASSDDAPLVAQKAVLDRGVKLKGLKLHGLDNRNRAEGLDEFLREREMRLLGDLTNKSIKQDLRIKGFRDLHAWVGDEARGLMSAPEALLRLLLKSGKLTRISPLVDLYNLVSAETRVALGAHDAARVSGVVRLAVTTGKESFVPLGTDDAVDVPAGEYAYIDDDDRILCRMEVRQGAATAVDSETKESLIIVQGNAAHEEADLRAACALLKSWVEEFLGGSAELLMSIRVIGD